jgi:hypothetical protein
MADLGRLLHPEDRESLLAAFPPAYGNGEDDASDGE